MYFYRNSARLSVQRLLQMHSETTRWLQQGDQALEEEQASLVEGTYREVRPSGKLHLQTS
jgi:hypothetical protein